MTYRSKKQYGGERIMLFKEVTYIITTSVTALCIFFGNMYLNSYKKLTDIQTATTQYGTTLYNINANSTK